MSGRRLRAAAAIALAASVGALLTACVPRESPVSVSWADGGPVVAYCGPAGVLTRVYVRAFDAETSDHVYFLLEDAANARITTGQVFSLNDLSALTGGGRVDPPAPSSSFAVILSVQADDDKDFSSASAEIELSAMTGTIADLPPEWIWASGRHSEERCGMPSSYVGR